MEDKIDLLMGYALVNPLAALAGSFLGWKAKEKAKAVSLCPCSVGTDVLLFTYYISQPHQVSWHSAALNNREKAKPYIAA